MSNHFTIQRAREYYDLGVIAEVTTGSPEEDDSGRGTGVSGRHTDDSGLRRRRTCAA